MIRDIRPMYPVIKKVKLEILLLLGLSVKFLLKFPNPLSEIQIPNQRGQTGTKLGSKGPPDPGHSQATGRTFGERNGPPGLSVHRDLGVFLTKAKAYPLAPGRV